MDHASYHPDRQPAVLPPDDLASRSRETPAEQASRHATPVERREARKRKEERIAKSSARRAQKRAQNLDARRRWIAGEALLRSLAGDWTAPDIRELIATHIHDANARAAFGLPPLADHPPRERRRPWLGA
jgi:hypothetical protein